MDERQKLYDELRWSRYGAAISLWCIGLFYSLADWVQNPTYTAKVDLPPWVWLALSCALLAGAVLSLGYCLLWYDRARANWKRYEATHARL
jgi:hypothetical protein